MDVEVPGGRLAVGEYEGTTEPVLAVHGISSQRKLWLWLHREAPDLRLIAPDLRGRADSIDVGGPFSMDRHADDLALVLDAAGLEKVHVCGMSMGAFVSVHMADRHPDRVRSLILVDGGLPVVPPPGLTRENVAVGFADRLGRLAEPWPDLDSYLDYFGSTTGVLLDRDDALLRQYLEHDLGADGRVRLSPTALLDDAADLFFEPNPFDRIDTPVRLSHAQWGAGPDAPPFYTQDEVAGWADRLAAVRYLPGHDHAGTIMTRTGAAATADLIREALRADPGTEDRTPPREDGS